MTHPWSELEAKMTPERLERIEREAAQMVAEIRERERRDRRLDRELLANAERLHRHGLLSAVELAEFRALGSNPHDEFVVPGGAAEFGHGERREAVSLGRAESPQLKIA